MRKILQVLAAVVLLAAASCGGDDDEVEAAPSTTTEAEVTTTAADGEATTTSEADTTTTAAAEDPDGPIVLLVAGALGVVSNTESGSTAHLAFGEATQDDAVAALEPALGEIVEENDLTECGEGPLHSVRFASLSVYFAEDVLQGWHLPPTGPIVLTTADGIGIGSTRADLEAQFADLAVQETSLGIEFTVGAEPGPYLSGTLVGDGPDAEIDAMWSGMTCIAR